MKDKYKSLYEVTGRIEDVATFLVPISDLPPQRTWVGLTDLENAKFVKTMERGNFLVAIYDIEKRLKEKNTCSKQ